MFEPLNFSHLPGLLLSPLHRGGRLSPGCPIPACLPVAMILGDIIYHLETALHELIAQVMAGAEPGLWTSTTNPAYTPSTALPPRVITLDPHSHCAPVLSSHPPPPTLPQSPHRTLGPHSHRAPVLSTISHLPPCPRAPTAPWLATLTVPPFFPPPTLPQSPHRTLDPEEADFFYLPVYGACVRVSSRVVVVVGRWEWP